MVNCVSLKALCPLYNWPKIVKRGVSALVPFLCLNIALQTNHLRDRAPLNSLFHQAFLARVVSWLAYVAIFMGHKNGDNKGNPRDDTCKDC